MAKNRFVGSDNIRLTKKSVVREDICRKTNGALYLKRKYFRKSPKVFREAHAIWGYIK